MIDIENIIFTKVKNALPKTIKFGVTYSKEVNSFPYVTIISESNTIYEPFIDSARVENAADIMFEVNVYSNKVDGKKEDCKKIMSKIDDVLSELNFTRVFCQPTPNLQDSTIYRMTARYRAIVDTNLNIYRR